MRPARDLATDLAVALVLSLGAAGVLGLVLGLFGVFRPLPVVLAGVAVLALAFAATWQGIDRRTLDGVLVFALALAVYAPAYDTTLYGSDATTYLGTGAHLARHGTFRIDAPVLHQIPTINAVNHLTLFPPYDPDDPRTRAWSLAGLAFDAGGPGAVYSTFAKLPSVWMALGFGVGGIPGAVAMSPLLGAGATMALHLFLRRGLGGFAAFTATGLLLGCAPQLVFARVSMGEIGGQFFLWGGLLALARWRDTRTRVAALAAGMGLGCAMLARPDLLLFVGLGTAVVWMLGVRCPAPPLAVATALALGAAACVLLASLPTHYRPALTVLLHDVQAFVLSFARQHPGVMVGGLVAGLGIVVWSARRIGGGSGRPYRMRTLGAVALALWGVAYGLQSTAPWFAGARLLPQYVPWLVLVASACGLPLLLRRGRVDPVGALALAIAGTAAVHLLYDPHVLPMPLWAGRRLVPAVLPLVFAAAGMGAARLRRVDWRLGVVLAVALVASNAMRARVLWHKPFLRGAEAAAAGIAQAIPEPNAFVVLDPSLFDALLDVSLWLVHGREALQLQGAGGDSAMVPRLTLDMERAGRPLYLVQHLFVPVPTAVNVVYTPVATSSSPIVPLDAADPPRTMLLAVRVLRVTIPGLKEAGLL